MTLFPNFGNILFSPQEHSASDREFVTIGDQVFAVAHSREEMARMMRKADRKVTGYVLQHRL